MTVVCQLVARCGFVGKKEKLIRDRLLAGYRVDRIRKNLLLEPDNLTLADALKIAQTVDGAVQESSLLWPKSKSLLAAEVG